MGLTFYGLKTLPKVFDVVWCKWPLRGKGIEPGPVVRPVLVLDVAVYEHENGFQFGSLIVQYGGSFSPEHMKDNLFIGAHQAGALGLHKSTVFRLDLSNRKRLPWSERYFVAQEYVVNRGIVAGSLTRSQIDTVMDGLKARNLSFPPPK